jgi:hypothetical protein
MKKFIRKILLSTLVIELISRVFIDPFYFNNIDTFSLKNNKQSLISVYSRKTTTHVDYLFLGSSRVAAAIDPAVFMKKNPGKIAIVAGRGYSTPGIQFQALNKRISEYPNYLKGANVLLEYPGPDIFTKQFDDDKWKVYEPMIAGEKAMPHLLLPYIGLKDLFYYLSESKNSFPVKLDLTLLYFISCYRTFSYIKEKVPGKILSNELIFGKSKQRKYIESGGIRNDNIILARQKAKEVAILEKQKIENNPLYTFNELNKSSLSVINNLIINHGGKLFLYKMPLSSVITNIYKSDQAKANIIVFEDWLRANNIEIINNEKFKYDDSDFPDLWHLRPERRAEFSVLLYEEIKN